VKALAPNPYNRVTVGDEYASLWRDMVDLMAELANVPVGLIMRVDGPQIEVFASSGGPDNPYTTGDSEEYTGSGLYCEWVVREESTLHVPDALKDPDWCENPDIELGMTSYLGIPILRPDGKVFGTLCILDRQSLSAPPELIRLMEKFKALVEGNLREIAARQEITAKERLLSKLSQIYPICAYCKSVQLETGEWMKVESYIERMSGQRASHGACPECAQRELDSFRRWRNASR
jgi:GAF domain-containing protein